MDYCIKKGVLLLLIILLSLYFISSIFMPEKYRYNYEGDVIKVEQYNSYEYKYTYIDKDTKKTMIIVQKIDTPFIFDKSYTYRNNNERVYTYRWYTYPFASIMITAICMPILILFYNEID